jgi:putative transposase
MEKPMKKKQFTEAQIIKILNEAESGVAARDLCRKHNISEQTFYRWRNKYGGMTVNEAKRLRELERENAELIRLVAEQALDIRMLKDVNEKKW